MKKSLILASSALVLAGLTQVASAGTITAPCQYNIVVVNDCGRSFGMLIASNYASTTVEVNETSSPVLHHGTLMTKLDAAHPSCPPFTVNTKSLFSSNPLYLPSNTAATVTFTRGSLGVCVPNTTTPPRG